ncbi:major capsid protein [Pseudomonas nicosulfuronedens]|uniref:major capsid protein n=1 Tax=Pseudomonas nicosulfuronedens TaxID=2571105 RepID=UPI00244B72C9|nr:major capsid protein [Pseudomonas nicosulfuronedens]MDH1008313.1 major capsid protein [Pseudomonas nicosulfuronedens]MDH1979271.1 major capsid protein [Pseudomonas nicosulfuronedens]MDH2027281.1 major capsid protein [Pseudomonas nicosulfuronedens]
MNQLKAHLQNSASAFGRKAAAVSALTIGAVGVAMADVPAAATTALTTAGDDTNTIGWAVFAVLVAAAAFKYMRRAL